MRIPRQYRHTKRIDAQTGMDGRNGTLERRAWYNLNLRQLKCFLAVARLQHVTRAAAELGITQPALSRAIRGLENELKVDLFTRVGRRGLIMTSAGKELVEHATQIFRTVEQARQAILAEGRIPEGMVTIGAPPSVGNLFCGMLIERYRTLYPNVMVRVRTAMSHRLVEWLRSGAIDLAIVSSPPAFPHSLNLNDLDCRSIAREDLHVFGSNTAQLPLDMPLEELASYPLILKDSSNMARQALESAANANGVRLRVVVEVENEAVLRHLVDRGMGLGVVPGSALVDDVDRFSIARLGGVSLDRLLVRNARRPKTPAITELNRVSLSLLDELKSTGAFENTALGTRHRTPSAPPQN
jgi:LysR family nitrogen assimilation transcriptional regulator